MIVLCHYSPLAAQYCLFEQSETSPVSLFFMLSERHDSPALVFCSVWKVNA